MSQVVGFKWGVGESGTHERSIICGIYMAQNWAGNLIANQAVYFFERGSERPHPPPGAECVTETPLP